MRKCIKRLLLSLVVLLISAIAAVQNISFEFLPFYWVTGILGFVIASLIYMWIDDIRYGDNWLSVKYRNIVALKDTRQVRSTSVNRIETLTQQEYDSLDCKDDSTLYLTRDGDKD